MARRLQEALGLPLEQIDLGGGLGVPYAEDEAPLDVEALGRGLARAPGGQPLVPGRADPGAGPVPGRRPAASTSPG